MTLLTLLDSFTPPTLPPTYGPTQRNPFTLFSFDLLSGTLIGTIPMRTIQFGQQLNAAGQMSGTIDLSDPRVQATNPIACTVPNRTFIAVDYLGSLVWGGIVQTRRWTVASSTSDTTRTLAIQAAEPWWYFTQRVQATDYTSPPSSGIVSPMALWTQTPWDASLIACQIIADAIGYSDSGEIVNGNLLGGLGLLLNGAPPNAAFPAAPSGDWIAINYPETTTQTVDTIVQQLSQLGLGVGFDFGVDTAYSGAPGTPPIATINLSYPRRGRAADENGLVVDLQSARGYEFPEDGTQTANQVYEIGGSGAIVVDQNVSPLDQGYPLWERVISRATAQSQNIISLLGQTGLADLALYSYAPVVPTVTLGLFDGNLPLGSFINGDNARLMLPQFGGDGAVFDPRFPAGLDQEWRIVEWQATVPDEGDPTLVLTLNQPPYLQALAPAI